MDKCLFISKSAIEHNINYYLSNTNKNVIAVIKNNAYGHGVKEMISILDNMNILMYAVSNFKEAKEVRKYTNKDVLIMDKIEEYDNLDDNFVITIISKKHLKQLIRLNKRIRVHVKINIMMKRKGIEECEFEECMELIKNSKLVVEGIYTHYSTYKYKPLIKQFNKFKELVSKIENQDLLIHASSSISSLLLDEKITNAIRVGVGMYGLKKLDKCMEPLKISSELKCSVKNSYPIKRFQRFSYHDRFFGKKGYVVMANIGYGDGLFFKNKLRGYLENGYIKEIGVRNMDNIYFYSREYILENTVIEIYGKKNKIDILSKKSGIAVCRILALLNSNIDKQIID